MYKLSRKIFSNKIAENIPCVYSISAMWGVDHIENKHTLYRRKDCKKAFCTSFREHAKNTIEVEKKLLSLT